MIDAVATQIAESTTEYAPFIESNANDDAAQLQAQMQSNGYVFFRALVPTDEVLELRRQALELCREAGWIDESKPLMDAYVKPGIAPTSEGHADYMAMYRKLLKTPLFHDLPARPELMQIASALLQTDAFVHPRRIGRVTFPNNVVATTPPHQDHYYIRGAVETYSCWIPLGECPMSLGGLAVWPGSRHRGYIEHTVHSPGAVGGCGVPIDEAQTLWHSSDFGLGDTLFFHSYTVHKALPNLSGDKLRLSTDNRYQRPKDDIDPGALLPHFGSN